MTMWIIVMDGGAYPKKNFLHKDVTKLALEAVLAFLLRYFGGDHVLE